MTATAPERTRPADAPPFLQPLVDGVVHSPRLQITAWVEFAEPLDLPGQALFGGKVAGVIRTTGMEMVIVIDDRGERATSAKVFGVRLTRSGEVDGRSRPTTYELSRRYREQLRLALDDRYAPVEAKE